MTDTMDTPGGPTDPDLGAVNYAAVRAAHPDGERWLVWEALDAAAQAPWIKGAAAVRNKLAP